MILIALEEMSKHIVINPATQKVLYEYDYSSKAEVESTLQEISTLGKLENEILSPQDRYSILNKLKVNLQKSKDQLAQIITEETGKVLTESLIEIDRAVITVEYSAEEARRLIGESQYINEDCPSEAQISIVVQKPIGVVFCITPFNFPLNLALHKIAPAFAGGNCILLKPSECNFSLAEKLVELCVDSGFPKNTIKMISPKVTDLNSVVADKRIDCISFTGGTKTANKIANLSGVKKLLFELGGNDALVVYPDGDLKLAAEHALTGRFGTAGQKCTASKRILIHNDIYSEFKTELLKQFQLMDYGIGQDPMDLKSIIGPLINIEAANNVKRIVDDAVKNGAKIIVGNIQEKAYYSATIVEDVPSQHELIREETFGPVMPLIRFSSDEEVIELINGTEYGLQAGVFTNNLARAKKLFNKIEVGTLALNFGPGFRKEYLPFGGVKASGTGREGVRNAIKEMSYTKQLIL